MPLPADTNGGFLEATHRSASKLKAAASRFSRQIRRNALCGLFGKLKLPEATPTVSRGTFLATQVGSLPRTATAHRFL
jgi:hypothetical protein